MRASGAPNCCRRPSRRSSAPSRRCSCCGRSSTSRASGAAPRRTAVGSVQSLTPSELRVARLAAEGLRNREIAEALFISRKTVDYHLGHVYQKLEVPREGLAEALAAKD